LVKIQKFEQFIIFFAGVQTGSFFHTILLNLFYDISSSRKLMHRLFQLFIS